MMFTFPENALNPCVFTHAPGPPLKTPGGGNFDWLYENSIRKYEDELEHYLYFVWFVIFLNVMALQFCE